MAYRKRLERDLDRWIEAGHVPADKRAILLAMVKEAPRLDAATALAWVGAVLLGLALVAFIAANWDGMPRILRFVLVLALFALAIGGAAWSAHRQRPMLSNALATISTLVFAAAVGLIGQIFDIAGKPAHALIGSGLGALLIAAAGRSSGAGVAALILIGLGDGMGGGPSLWWLFAASIPAALAAWSWRAAPLAHASSLALAISIGWLAGRADAHQAWFLLATAIAAGLAYLARSQTRDEATGVFATFYGWAVWAGLAYFVAAGIDAPGAHNIPHRLVWLAAAGGAIALGRHDRHAMITAAGVIALIGAAMTLLADLGLDLLSAALIFFVCALIAMVAGLVLRRANKTPEAGA
jgi:uncharacterized membrane protein